MKTRLLITLFITLSISVSYTAQRGNQNTNTGQNRTGANSTNAQNQNNSRSNELASGYRGVKLGMKLEKVREILKKDRLLEIDIRTDFGDLDEEPYHMIRARHVPYIKSIYYQFGTTQSVSKTLFAIIIHFNKKYNEFFMLFKKLKKKYGQPKMLTPKMAFWTNNKVKLILNYPATVKYIDIELYRKMQREYAYLRYRFFPPTDNAANRELTDDL